MSICPPLSAKELEGLLVLPLAPVDPSKLKALPSRLYKPAHFDHFRHFFQLCLPLVIPTTGEPPTVSLHQVRALAPYAGTLPPRQPVQGATPVPGRCKGDSARVYFPLFRSSRPASDLCPTPGTRGVAKGICPLPSFPSAVRCVSPHPPRYQGSFNFSPRCYPVPGPCKGD